MSKKIELKVKENSSLEEQARAIGMTEEYAKRVTNQIQIEAFKTGLIFEIAVPLINSKYQLEALRIGMPSLLALEVSKPIQIEAFRAGMEAERALKATEGRLEGFLKRKARRRAILNKSYDIEEYIADKGVLR